MRTREELRARLITLAALACTACASTRDVRMDPPIQDTELRGDDGGLQARVSVEWRGMKHQGDDVELRFRTSVDNQGFTPFALEPAEFELLDGRLEPIGVARVDGMPSAIAAGRSATFALAFTVPRAQLEESDLSALLLRAHFEGERWTWSAAFARDEPEENTADEEPLLNWRVGVALGGR